MLLGYKNIHKKLAIKYGKAKEYVCTDCGNQAFDWSYEHDTDPYDLDNYYPRCRSCHLKYDAANTVRGEQHGKATISEVAVLEARDLFASGEYNICSLSERYGVKYNAMYRLLHRITWRHI